MKLYDLVKDLLEEKPERRNSDKMLMFAVWNKLGLLTGHKSLHYGVFINKNCPTPESITRCRRKIQEKHPELAGFGQAKKMRDEKEATKGTFIYRD